MLLKRIREHKGYFTFNMMPIIDIVMLLIIFFMFVCRYIEAENFAILVPDEATNAITDEQDPGFITVSVWLDDYEDLFYCAVGAEVIDITDGVDITSVMSLINGRIDEDNENTVVNLRMNRDIRFNRYSDIIKAISASNATDIAIAALDDSKD